MKNPLIVALDIDDVARASAIFRDLQPLVGGFKIGPRLSMRCDASFIKTIANDSLLFWDHKYFDIPSTVCAAAQTAFDEKGAHWVTAHALNGVECLRDLANVESLANAHPNQSGIRKRVLIVTVLTSFSEKTLPPVWGPLGVNQSVSVLSSMSKDCGLNSFVCSAHEAAGLRKAYPDAFLVVPGIRLDSGSRPDDQSRTATPAEALRAGASAIVVGRPIVTAPDPVKAAEDFLRSLP